ncbi:MAG: hypothetical protein EOL97_16735 [Spirochaetia bacterium]|nr:hypothetical protein [Spirochaetia bacterium]
MEIKVNTKGFDNLEKRFLKMQSIDFKPELKYYAGAIQAKAKLIAPRDPSRPPKDMSRPVTGNLRNSIKVSVMNLKALVFTNWSYAIYQEFGTRYMKARPFLIPSFLEYRKKFKDDIKLKLTRGIKK